MNAKGIKVEVRQVQLHHVELSESEALGIVQTVLHRMVYPGEYLRERGGVTIVAQDDPDHRHGSVSEVEVRVATDFDKAAFLVLAQVNQLYTEALKKEGRRG